MVDDGPMAWRERLTSAVRRSDEPEAVVDGWLETAGMYAEHLTETGSRCHRNDGSTRFCHWKATRLDNDDPAAEPAPAVGVRCTIHPGGRYLDSRARLDPEDLG
jgi:hypothetical protein